MLVTSPAAPRLLRRVLRDRMTLRIRLRDFRPVEDADRLALAGIG